MFVLFLHYEELQNDLLPVHIEGKVSNILSNKVKSRGRKNKVAEGLKVI